MSILEIDTSARRALTFTPMEVDWRVLVDAAVHAESVGYEAVVVPEGWGLDATLVLSEIARNTSRIGLVSGILSIWGRSAATLAMTASMLDDLSDGRFTLGLGTSTPILAEQLHSVPFVRPAARLASTVDTVRRLLDGQRADDFAGRRGLRLGVDARPRVPIWVAGLGPRAVETAVHHADGWFPAVVPRSTLSTRCEAFDVDRRTRCRLISGPITAVTTGRNDGRRAAEQLLGWYMTGMGSFYGDYASANGFADEIAVLRAANPDPRPGSLAWPEDANPLLQEFTVHGQAREVAAGLHRWDEVCDIVAVTTGPVPTGVLHDLIDSAAPRVARRSA